MEKGRLAHLVGHVTALLHHSDGGDGELLELFIQQHDESAFEALVRQHGPMVFGVCLRVLGNLHDAEDAFQATFLVLARKAASVRPRYRVGNWLYGVACRTAQEARRANARRRAREAKVLVCQESPSAAGEELRELLDQELTRLPEHYREVVVLCDLEGRGRQEVAELLGCPEGTVASRLARARALLQRRLERRGLIVSAVSLTATLAPASASAVPVTLVAATVRGALLAAAGQSAVGVIPGEVLILTERVLRTMVRMKLKAILAVLVLVGFLGTGASWFWYQGAGAAPPRDKTAATPAQNPGAAQTEQLRQEFTLLKQELQKALERTAALEARLPPKAEERPEVLFEGKPASYWVKQSRDRSRKYRLQAIQALAAIVEDDRTVAPILEEAMLDRDNLDVRDEAADALVKVGRDVVPSLLRALKDPRKEKRVWVLYVLGRIVPEARTAVPALTELLKSSESSDRFAAAVVLGNIGPDAKDAIPALLKLLKDPKKAACFAAVEALGRIGPGAKAAVPPLIELLKEDKPIDYYADYPPSIGGLSIHTVILAEKAAEALGNVGPDAKAAIPALLKCCKDSIRGAPRGSEATGSGA